MSDARVIVAVIADGQVRFHTADNATGNVEEWARIRVSPAFGAHDAIALGLELSRTLNGSTAPAKPPRPQAPRRIVSEPARGNPRPLVGASLVVHLLRQRQPQRPMDLIAQGASNSVIQRAANKGYVRRTSAGIVLGDVEPPEANKGGRPSSAHAMTAEAVLRYIAEHPGSSTNEIASGLGYPREGKAVQNRLYYLRGRVRKERVPNEGRGGHMTVRYFMADDADES